MEDFNIAKFKEDLEKDMSGTLLEFDKSLTEFKLKYNEQSKTIDVLTEKNNMLVESNSKMFLSLANKEGSNDNTEPQDEKEPDLDELVNSFFNKEEK